MAIESTLLLRAGAGVCKVLPRKLRTALAYQLARVRARGTVGREIAPGVRLDLDLGDWIQRLYFLGETDRAQLQAVMALTPRSGTVVDAGANIGLYACVLGHHVGPAGKVLAFEPMPQNLALLRHNVRLNRLENVDVHAAALSSVEESVDLYVPSAGPAGPSAATRVANPGNWHSIGRVPAMPLDHVFVGERLDLLKIDVEGHEDAVLDGGRMVIERFRPVIVVEVQPWNRATVSSLARDLHYDVLAQAQGGGLTRHLPDAGPRDLFLVPREAGQRSRR